MADILERSFLAPNLLAAVLSSFILSSCGRTKNDSMKLSPETMRSLVGLAEGGSSMAAKRLSLHFSYGAYDPICAEQWRLMALFLGDSASAYGDESPPKLPPTITDDCRR
jgi:hypothetical protein